MEDPAARADWRPLLDTLPQGVLVADAEGRFVEANGGACRILGSSRQDLLRAGFFDPRWTALGPDGSRLPADEFPGVLTLRAPVRQRSLGLVKEDGETLWLEISAGPLPDGGTVLIFDDVTERHRLGAILEARSCIVDAAVSGTLEDVLRVTLDEAERLTGSCIGFCHFLARDQVSLSLQAWSTRTAREFCRAEGRGLHYPVDQAGVWVDAIREKRPVIHNDYASLPHRKGLPEGHAEVTRMLAVPIFRGGSIVALLGVGNKPFPYGTSDVETVQRLADLAWDTAEQKRTQEFLRFEAAALEHSLNGVALADFEGRLVYVNPAFVALWGLESRHACLGSDVWDFWTDREAGKAVLASVVAEGQPQDGELQSLRGDGTMVDVHFTATLAKDAAGRSLGVLGTFLDVTERNRNREALRQYAHDLGERVKELNCLYGLSLLAEASGDSLESLLRGVAELLPPAWQYPTIACARVTLGEQTFTADHFEQTRWRQQRPIRVGEALAGTVEMGYKEARPDCDEGPFLWQEGKLLDAIAERLGKAVDRIQTRRALRESRVLLNSIVNGTTDAIYVKDREGRYLMANDATCRLLGKPREEILGQDDRALFPATEAEAVMAGDRRVMESRVTATYEEVVTDATGRLATFLSTKGPLLDEAGRLLGLFGIARDVTDRDAAARQRLEMERKLLHAQKLESLGLMAGGIAHDFNNLLLAMLANLDIACQELPAASPAREDLAEARKATLRAADLARQMLAYAGKGAFETRPVDLLTLVEENARILRAALAKTANVRLQLDRELPLIEGDPGQLQQVVMNLLTNASEALGSRPGVVTLTTGTVDLAEGNLGPNLLPAPPPPGRFVCLQVADDGCGMDPETRARLFDPFFTTKSVGRGLGLSAVLGIVRGHGGAISVDSEPGRGTLIRVLFPVTERPAAVAEPARPTSPVAETSPWLRPARVLVVDDDDAVLSALHSMLRRLDCEVVAASSGEEALVRFLEEGGLVDCVLLDLTMPGMDGIATYREMERLRPGVKVVLSSGYGEQDLAVQVSQLGVAAFIQKPYSLQALREVLSRVLVP